MPQFTWRESVVDGATLEPLSGWQYEYVPFGGLIKILHQEFDATNAAGTTVTITSGSDTLQESSPVPAGSVSGAIPSELDVPPVMDEVAAGDRLKILYRNNSGVTKVISGLIDYTIAA